MKPVQIELSAAQDAERAAGWYESQQLNLGTEFILELDAAIERAAENPEAYEQIYRIWQKRNQRTSYASITGIVMI